jgi:hypothetical protein
MSLCFFGVISFHSTERYSVEVKKIVNFLLVSLQKPDWEREAGLKTYHFYSLYQLASSVWDDASRREKKHMDNMDETQTIDNNGHQQGK